MRICAPIVNAHFVDATTPSIHRVRPESGEDFNVMVQYIQICETTIPPPPLAPPSVPAWEEEPCQLNIDILRRESVHNPN